MLKDRNRLDDVIILSVILAIVTVIFPSFLLWQFGAVQEETNLWKFWTYVGISLGSFIAVVGLQFSDKISKGHELFRNLFSYIHNPERGYLKEVKWITNPYKLATLCFIFFTFVSMLSAYYNTFFVVPLSFEGSPVVKTLVGVEPVASGETLMLFALLLPVQIGLLSYFFKKKFGMEKKDALMIASLLGIILVGLIEAPALHTVASTATEFNMLGIMVFFLVSAILTVATGSIIPTWIWHQTTLAFFTINKLFSNEFSIVIGVAIIIFSIIVYFLTRKK